MSNPIRVAHILRATAEVTGIDALILISPSRLRVHVRARQMAMYVAREVGSRSYPDIGRRMGERDHTTVLFACRSVKQRIAVSSEAREQFRNISARAREIAMAPPRELDPLDMGGPEKPDRRFTKTHQPDPDRRRAGRMKRHRPEPQAFPERAPSDRMALPTRSGRPASTESNSWLGGWPMDEDRQPRANVGAGAAPVIWPQAHRQSS